VISENRGWLERLVAYSTRNPRPVIAAWLIAAVSSTFGIGLLVVDTGTSAFLNRTSAAWAVYQNSLREFGGDEVVVVAFEGSRPFDPDTIEKIQTYSREFEKIPGVRRVDSIASFPIIDSDESGSLLLTPAVERVDHLDEAGVSRIADLIRSDRIAPSNFVSSDEKLLAINLVLDSDVDRGRDVVVSEVRRLIGEESAWVSGVPIFRTEVNSQTREELAAFIPLTILIIGCIVAIATGSLGSVVISLVPSCLAVWGLVGIMGAMRVPLSLSTMILPSILLALGSAYTMHLLSALSRVGLARNLESVLIPVAKPLGLSGLTTALGFLAMSTVRIDAIYQLGLFGSIGVMIILVATLTLAPALIASFPIRQSYSFRSAWITTAVDLLIRRTIGRNRILVLLAWSVIILGSVIGICRLHVETDIILWFSDRTDVRRSYEAIRTHLSGITPVNVVVSADQGRAVTEEATLRSIRDLSDFLEAHPFVGRSISIADPLIQIHREMGFDQLETLPTDPNTVSQYLLLLESLDQISDVIAPDRKSANIVMRLTENGSEAIMNLSAEIAEWWRMNGPPGFSAETTGVMFEFARAEEEIAYGQIRGLGLALIAIGVVLIAIYRKLLVALVAMVPNIAPLAIAYGFMGSVGIPLDAATICIGSLALGIAVDDTIHLMTAFYAEKASGATAQSALRIATSRVSPALVYSTVAISCGFAVLGASNFSLIRNLGTVTAGMVVICLIADLTVLPILLDSINSRSTSEGDI